MQTSRIVFVSLALSLLSPVSHAAYNTSAVCFAGGELPAEYDPPSALLACALPAPGKMPKIIVAGEMHGYATTLPGYSESDLVAPQTNSAQFRDHVKQLAVKGKALIAAESLPATQNAHRFEIRDYHELYDNGYAQFPIEGELELALAGMIHYSTIPLYTKLADVVPAYKNYIEERVDELLFNFAMNNYMQMAWKKVARPYQDSQTEFTALMVDALSCAREPRARVSQMRKILTGNQRQALVIILGDIYSKLAVIYEERAEDKKLGAKIRGLIEGKSYLKSAITFQKEFLPLVNQIRDEKILANMGILYCALAPKGMDVYLNVGNAHAPVLDAGLKKLFSERGLDPALIKMVDTTKPQY